MPIDAYKPEWFMKESHQTPEDAVKGFLELAATTFIPIPLRKHGTLLWYDTKLGLYYQFI